MNLKERMILEEYRSQREDFIRLGDVVRGILGDQVKAAGINILAIEHRVKEEDSLAGKLERKGDRYASLADLTDILGARIICYFNDDVERIGKLMEQVFVIDWENSEDKRALIQADSFGYLSLHYICSLPEGAGYPAELCGKKFELQIRTILQHTWAVINHDMGYKSEFGVPRVVVRQFARIAGLLEIADAEFIRARDDIHNYAEDIRQKIAHDEAGDVLIDMVSLREYIQRNRSMRAFLEELAAICGAEISEISPESYIQQLRWLGIRTLGDLQTMLKENHDLALTLARQALEHTDLDILSSSVGLRFLCRAELLSKGYTQAQGAEFLALSVGDEARAQRMAAALFRKG